MQRALIRQKTLLEKYAALLERMDRELDKTEPESLENLRHNERRLARDLAVTDRVVSAWRRQMPAGETSDPEITRLDGELQELGATAVRASGRLRARLREKMSQVLEQAKGLRSRLGGRSVFSGDSPSMVDIKR